MSRSCDPRACKTLPRRIRDPDGRPCERKTSTCNGAASPDVALRPLEEIHPIELKDFFFFVLVEKSNRHHPHVAHVVGGCPEKTADQRTDRINGAAFFAHVRAGVPSCFTELPAACPKKSFQPLVFDLRPRWNTKIATALDTTGGTCHIGHQIVEIFYVHAG